MMQFILKLGLGWMMMGSLWSHELHHTLQPSRTAAVLTLIYADETPFAFESYELFAINRPEDPNHPPTPADIPVQVGQTNAAGQIVWLPEGHRQWRIKALSKDGHGLNQMIELPPITTTTPTTTITTTTTITPQTILGSSLDAVPRWWKLLTGLSLIFGLLGVWGLFRKK